MSYGAYPNTFPERFAWLNPTNNYKRYLGRFCSCFMTNFYDPYPETDTVHIYDFNQNSEQI